MKHGAISTNTWPLTPSGIGTTDTLFCRLNRTTAKRTQIRIHYDNEWLIIIMKRKVILCGIDSRQVSGERILFWLHEERIQHCWFSQEQLIVPGTRKIYEPGAHTLFIYSDLQSNLQDVTSKLDEGELKTKGEGIQRRHSFCLCWLLYVSRAGISNRLGTFQCISNKMQRYTVYLYLEIALHVSSGIFTHHQEHTRLYLQHLVIVKRSSNSSTIAAGSSNGLTITRCCR